MSRNLPLIILSIMVCMHSFADSSSNAVPNSLKVMGRGIQNSKTNEIILIACVGVENDCNTLRMVQLKPQTTPTWLGASFPIENSVQVQEELRQWYSDQWINGVFMFLNSNYTYAFTDKNGWNWANSPLQLSQRKFKRVLSSILYFAEFSHASEFEKKIIPNHVTKKQTNVLKDNFDKCYKLKNLSIHSNTAVDQCMIDAKEYVFIDNPSFDKCYQLKNLSLQSNNAVDQCMI